MPLSRPAIVVVALFAFLNAWNDFIWPLLATSSEEMRTVQIGLRYLFREELELLADTHLTLRCELKPDHRLMPYPGIVDATVERLEAHAMLERTVFTSFHLPTVAELVERDLAVQGVIWLVTERATRLLGARAIVALARDVGVRSIAIHEALLDVDTFESLGRAGLEVGAFVVLEDEAIERMLLLGVAVFTTDRPDAAIDIRARLADRSSPVAPHRAGTA